VTELNRAGTFQVPARFSQPRPTEIGGDRLQLSLTLGKELYREPQSIATCEPGYNAEADNRMLLLGSVRETGGLSQVFPVGELLEHEVGDV